IRKVSCRGSDGGEGMVARTTVARVIRCRGTFDVYRSRFLAALAFARTESDCHHGINHESGTKISAPRAPRAPPPFFHPLSTSGLDRGGGLRSRRRACTRAFALGEYRSFRHL